jgi:hypothetical protein
MSIIEAEENIILVRTLIALKGGDHGCAQEKTAAIAFDRTGNLYVLDTGNYRVQKFGPDGKCQRPSDGSVRGP